MMIVVKEHDVPTFISQLEETHILDFDDLDYDGGGRGGDNEEQESEEEDDPGVEEVNKPVDTQVSNKRARTLNYMLVVVMSTEVLEFVYHAFDRSWSTT